MKDISLSQNESRLADTQPAGRHKPAGETERARLEALLHEARTAADGDAALEYVQRAVDLAPDDARVHSMIQVSVFQKLSSDAFLAFLAETDRRYVITFRDSAPLSVPKARQEQEAYPPRRTEAEKALGMMWWLLLGLIPAGLGTVTLSPFVLRRAIAALQHAGADRHEERMARVAILMALGLGLLGLVFTALLVLHFLLE